MANSRSPDAAGSAGEESKETKTINLSNLNDHVCWDQYLDIQCGNNGIQLINFTGSPHVRDYSGIRRQAVCKDFKFINTASGFCADFKTEAILLKKSGRLALPLFPHEVRGLNEISVSTYEYRASDKGVCVSTCVLPKMGKVKRYSLIELPATSEYEMLLFVSCAEENALRLFFINQNKFQERRLLFSHSPDKAKSFTFNYAHFVEPNFLVLQMKQNKEQALYRVPLSLEFLEEDKALDDGSSFDFIRPFPAEHMPCYWFSAFPECRTLLCEDTVFRLNWESHSAQQAEYKNYAPRYKMDVFLRGESKIFPAKVIQGMLIAFQPIKLSEGNFITNVYAYDEDLSDDSRLLLGEVPGRVEEHQYFCDFPLTKQLGVLVKGNDRKPILHLMPLPALILEPEMIRAVLDAVDHDLFRAAPLASMILDYRGRFFDDARYVENIRKTTKSTLTNRIDDELKKLDSKENAVDQKRSALVELKRLLDDPRKLSIEACIKHMLKHYFNKDSDPSVVTFIKEFTSNAHRPSAGPGP